ncbi:hypothetical protein BV25DRAFT_1912955 [Artomyces pyxidatus]|uniref:Uncharacterized protein n=1 Tax=Artomyces pyxidatus TaxID=48021 RepID=A0ACB8TDC5_9AGAM|nr:hypothetical protein BV25DRAFT_1912955 [Artomyces pyxidatus]
MHRCLQVSEIFHEILGFALANNGGKRDVAAFALACKSTLEPALDVLWRDLDDIRPLWSCLPLDLQLARAHLTLGTNIRTADDLLPSRGLYAIDRLRLDFYARRVRTLAYDPATFRLELFHAASSSHFVEPFVLPALVRLTWHLYTLEGGE